MRNGLKWLLALFKVKRIKQANIAWREVFNKQDSRVEIILQDLATYCNFHKSSFSVQDPYKTAFNEGARDVFLHILEMTEIKESEVVQLLNTLNEKE